jgi:hypothetical protein
MDRSKFAFSLVLPRSVTHAATLLTFEGEFSIYSNGCGRVASLYPLRDETARCDVGRQDGKRRLCASSRDWVKSGRAARRARGRGRLGPLTEGKHRDLRPRRQTAPRW